MLTRAHAGAIVQIVNKYEGDRITFSLNQKVLLDTILPFQTKPEYSKKILNQELSCFLKKGDRVRFCVIDNGVETLFWLKWTGTCLKRETQ